MRAELVPVLLAQLDPARQVPLPPPDLSAEERRLVDASAALRAGDAKAALAALDGMAGAVALSMRAAAMTADRNWYPGGGAAIADTADFAAMIEPPDPPTDDAAAAVLVIAFGHVAAIAPTWRSIASGFGRFGRADQVGPMLLTAVDQRAAALRQLGATAAAADLALVGADLARRAGAADAFARWQAAAAAYATAGDELGQAWCHVVSGDWAAAPAGTPELLGFDLEAVDRALPVDVAAAAASYEAAANVFVAAGHERALAALALRRGHLARLAGDGALWSQAAGEAERLASAGGDHAPAQIAAVHRALAAVHVDGDVDAGPIGVAAARWATERGSTSLVRGLVRLAVAVASAWRRNGEFVRARAALDLAESLGQAVGAPVEPTVIARELAELYRQSFPLAAVVLGLGDVDELLANLSPTDEPVAWMTVADRAMAVHSAAVSRQDGAAITAGARRLDEVVRRAPASVGGDAMAVGGPTPSQMVEMVLAMVRESAASAAVLVPLYRAIAERENGDDAAALQSFAAAETAARAGGDDLRLLLVTTLATAGRTDEAAAVAEQVIAAGLSADLAVELLLRVDRPERAAALAAGLPALEALGPDDWEARAQRAELAERNGDATAARRLVDEAVAVFERRLLRFGRDALTSVALDRPGVAGMYLTAVRAHLAAGDEAGIARALAASDRGRGVALADLLEAGAGPGGAELRAWRRAASRWAAAFEELAGAVDAPPTGEAAVVAQRVVAQREADLDDAERAVALAAPGLLVAQRQPAPPCDVAMVAAALPVDTVLVQFHSTDHDLVAWTVSNRGVAAHRSTVDRRELAARAARCRRAAAGGEDAPGDSSALTAALLDPIGDALAAHGRVVIVPHAGLTALPFHLLPFEGDVLGARRIVSYLPSSSLAPPRARSTHARTDMGALVVGGPTYAPERHLRPLPGAVTEALTVARLVAHGGALTGAAATADAVTAAAARHPLLHLATHGIVHERAPNRSALALAGTEELTVGDLMGLPLDADLVVLSACDSGRGSATAGGDVVGLVRALLAAGARHAVVALWPVDDHIGCLLMTTFYERLVAGEAVADALTASSTSVRQLTPAERAERYEAIRAAVGTEVSDPVSRDLVGSPPPVRASAVWAPFVHVGL